MVLVSDTYMCLVSGTYIACSFIVSHTSILVHRKVFLCRYIVHVSDTYMVLVSDTYMGLFPDTYMVLATPGP